MDTIVAVSTPYGTGGIAVIRLSGPEALHIADAAWRGIKLSECKSHTAHFGTLTADNSGEPLDQCVATIFRAPNSFTGEDTVEFSIHGSKWLQRQAVERLIALGARGAEPGEFTRRAFLNGRMDLTQAEGVADMITVSSRAAQRLAMRQMSGGFSRRLSELRDNLVDIASLLELELDFSEEDVEFADRERLRGIADETLEIIERLASTYKAGKAFKEGVPVTIAGSPNAGKSTLLNILLGEEKAIVSDIPGTTRDVIEDTREIGGVLFRFHDTAGLHATTDTVEQIGIERAQEAIAKAAIVIWVIDATLPPHELKTRIAEIKDQIATLPDSDHIIVCNKTDLSAQSRNRNDEESLNNAMPALTTPGSELSCANVAVMNISAKTGSGISDLEEALTAAAKSDHDPDAELIITNSRHHAALESGAAALRRARQALDTGLSADFIAQDIRETLHHLGLLTGTITTDTLLTTIFSRFCIGK